MDCLRHQVKPTLLAQVDIACSLSADMRELERIWKEATVA